MVVPRETMNASLDLSIGQCATLACLFEVTAPKPGNVHRGADFHDTTLNDFMASAVALGPVMDRAADQRVGKTVLNAVEATRLVTSANTNLGMVLLLAPLATVPRNDSLKTGLHQVLARLNSQDAADVFHSIELAQPGGLLPRDRAPPRYDVSGPPPTDLLAAMGEAAEWDLIARQYVNGFQQVLREVLPWLLRWSDHPWPERIVYAHVRLMSEHPDSLIARKCGRSVAEESAARATAVLEAGPVGSHDYWRAVADLDFWLRSDGNRRNPGTTADLIAAGIFAGLREGVIGPPF
jgi:triphosphoribosyl-dephospho-CoA synthase